MILLLKVLPHMLDLLLVAGATDMKNLRTVVHQVKPAVKGQFFVRFKGIYAKEKQRINVS